MRYSLLLLLVTSVVTFNVLKLLFMSWFPDLMMNLSLGLLTVVLADLLVKLAANVLPRKLLPDLENKAVFITGCDSGFGNLCARRLDALGTTVYAGCLMPEGVGAKELKDATSDRLHIVPLDVTKQDDVDKVVEHVRDTLGDQGISHVIDKTPQAMRWQIWNIGCRHLGSAKQTRPTGGLGTGNTGRQDNRVLGINPHHPGFIVPEEKAVLRDLAKLHPFLNGPRILTRKN
uniref:(California timema) hypothetical protein n=1 Tax=Timema californicum TaxID=61474 RepID=A0A7R9JGU7_TIMCA|nr:unnamed protein product [Timema californicum]